MSDIIFSTWQGKVSLAKAFWGYFVLGQILLSLTIVALSLPSLLFGVEGIEKVSTVTFPIYDVFLVWALVGIWKCSPNTRRQPFSIAAKAFVILFSSLWVVASVQYYFA
jgi:hypothetical protein